MASDRGYYSHWAQNQYITSNGNQLLSYPAGLRSLPPPLGHIAPVYGLNPNPNLGDHLRYDHQVQDYRHPQPSEISNPRKRMRSEVEELPPNRFGHLQVINPAYVESLEAQIQELHAVNPAYVESLEAQIAELHAFILTDTPC